MDDIKATKSKDIAIPYSVSDVLLHTKEKADSERVILPITRYKNIMNAPRLVSSSNAAKGAPFVLFETDQEVLSIEELRTIAPDVI